MTTHDVSPVRGSLLILAMSVATHGLLLLALSAVVAAVWIFGLWLILAFVAAGAVFVVVEAVMGDRSPGWTVRPQDEAELVRLVEDTAARMAFDHELILRIVPAPGAALGYERVEGSGTFVLEIGLPYVIMLSEGELTAVIAHELAHVDDLRTWHGRAAVTARTRLAAARFAIPIVSGLLLQASRARTLDTELYADAAAVSVVGGQQVVDALVRTSQVDELWDTLVSHWIETMIRTREFPVDVYICAEQAMDDPDVVRWLDANIEREIEVPAPGATHPTRAERIRRAGADVRPSHHDVPVRIHHRDPIEEWCLREVFEPDRTTLHRGSIKGSRLGRFDHDPAHALADVRRLSGEANTRTAMLHLVERIEDKAWRELAHRLEPRLDDLPPDSVGSAEQGVMVSCLGTALVVPLLTAGWHRASPWLNHVVMSPDGTLVDVYAVVDQCLETCDATELRALISAAALVSA